MTSRPPLKDHPDGVDLWRREEAARRLMIYLFGDKADTIGTVLLQSDENAEDESSLPPMSEAEFDEFMEGVSSRAKKASADYASVLSSYHNRTFSLNSTEEKHTEHDTVCSFRKVEFVSATEAATGLVNESCNHSGNLLGKAGKALDKQILEYDGWCILYDVTILLDNTNYSVVIQDGYEIGQTTFCSYWEATEESW